MRRSILLTAAAGAAITLFGTGVPHAQAIPDLSGKKYSEVAAQLNSWGYVVRVASRVGDQLPESDCIVTDQQDLALEQGFGPPQFGKAGTSGSGKKTYALSLNCEAAVASASQPGNSQGSVGGRAAKKIEDKVAYERTPEGQKFCEVLMKANPEWPWDTDPGLAGCRSGG